MSIEYSNNNSSVYVFIFLLKLWILKKFETFTEFFSSPVKVSNLKIDESHQFKSFCFLVSADWKFQVQLRLWWLTLGDTLSVSHLLITITLASVLQFKFTINQIAKDSHKFTSLKLSKSKDEGGDEDVDKGF